MVEYFISGLKNNINNSPIEAAELLNPETGIYNGLQKWEDDYVEDAAYTRQAMLLEETTVLYDLCNIFHVKKYLL